MLYWQIGRDIPDRQTQQGWKAKVIQRLSHDLRTAFSNMKGFSRANLNICARTGGVVVEIAGQVLAQRFGDCNRRQTGTSAYCRDYRQRELAFVKPVSI